jgi:hypothetical protein
MIRLTNLTHRLAPRTSATASALILTPLWDWRLLAAYRRRIGRRLGALANCWQAAPFMGHSENGIWGEPVTMVVSKDQMEYERRFCGWRWRLATQISLI